MSGKKAFDPAYECWIIDCVTCGLPLLAYAFKPRPGRASGSDCNCEHPRRQVLRARKYVLVVRPGEAERERAGKWRRP